MFGGASAVDPYILVDLTPLGWVPSNNSIQGRTRVSPYLAAERTCVLLFNGQSNNANAALDGFYTPVSPKAQEFNICDGAIYQCAERPTLGAGGFGGASSPKLADLLIAHGYFDRVIIANSSIGSTRVDQHAPGGVLNHRIAVMAKRLAAVHLTPTFVIWDQGESDVGITSQADYTSRLNSVIATYRGLGITCPFFVNYASRWGAPDATIRAAQAAAVDNVSVFHGADVDTIGDADRTVPDLNISGMLLKAALEATVLENWIDTH